MIVDRWYGRPRLFEIADQWWCPSFMRQHEYTFLEYIWSYHSKAAQDVPLYERAARIVSKAVEDVETAHRKEGVDGEGIEVKVQVVDFCSGAGGPMPSLERVFNEKRVASNKPPIPFLLSDLRPHPVWPEVCAKSQYLSFIPQTVNATSSADIAPPEGTLQVRTLFVSFHHMDQEGARKVIEDAMRNAESLVIVEMSEFSFAGCFTGPVGLTVMGQLFTPRLRPTWLTLLFTYLIPWTPIMFWWDALISAYRTYAPHHILHLAKQAEANVNRDIDEAEDAALASAVVNVDDEDGKDGGLRRRGAVENAGKKAERIEWEWEFGKEVHTRPDAMMLSAIGRRVRK